MREYRVRARWVLSVRAGLTYGLVSAGAALFLHRSLPDAVGPGLAGGVIYGLIAGARQAERRAAEDEVLARVPPDGRRAARRAARRGPVPRDPVARDAALRLVKLRSRGSSGWSRVASLTVVTLLLLTSLLLAATAPDRPRLVWLVGAALLGCGLVVEVRSRARLTRRAALLRAEP